MLWQARRGLIAGRGALTGAHVPTWQDTFTQTLGNNSTGWSGFNLRMRVDSAALSLSGTQTRLTLQASTAGGCAIDGIYIGHPAGSGDAYDFDGGQVQVTVGSSASFSISANTSVVTDDIAFSLDNTKGVIVAVHFNTTSAVRAANGVSNTNGYFKSAANETSTTDVSGYTSAAGALRLLSKIEVFA